MFWQTLNFQNQIIIFGISPVLPAACFSHPWFGRSCTQQDVTLSEIVIQRYPLTILVIKLACLLYPVVLGNIRYQAEPKYLVDWLLLKSHGLLFYIAHQSVRRFPPPRSVRFLCRCRFNQSMIFFANMTEREGRRVLAGLAAGAPPSIHVQSTGKIRVAQFETLPAR